MARASGAIVSQGSAAAGNLMVQVVAARTLSAERYGTFTILMAVLVLMAALHGGWVGDARTVLDRTEPAIRGALVAFQGVFTFVGAVVAFVGVWGSGLTDTGSALLFTLLGAAWVLEDVGRRLFMTRLEFWKVVINDVVYLAGAGVTLVVVRAVVGRFSLTGLLLAMAIGAVAAVIAARLQLPAEEYDAGEVSRTGLRTVAGFGSWRSAQEGIRPLTTLLLRSAVPLLASAAALGRLEAARLAIAPVVLAINGVGSFLLPVYARRQRATPHERIRIGPLAAVLVALCVAYGVILTALAGRVMGFVTGDGLAVDRWAVAGWCLFGAAFAAGIPAGSVLLARRKSLLVFRFRALDSGIGLVSAIVLMAIFGPSLAPYGLALGAAVGAALLSQRANRPDGSTLVAAGGAPAT